MIDFDYLNIENEEKPVYMLTGTVDRVKTLYVSEDGESELIDPAEEILIEDEPEGMSISGYVVCFRAHEIHLVEKHHDDPEQSEEVTDERSG